MGAASGRREDDRNVVPRGAPRFPCCRLRLERARLDKLHAIEADAYAASYRFVAGVDEVGRGCLAGPLVAHCK